LIYLDSKRKLRIAFCILNWGLGHATRSSVIIDQLMEQGHDVTVFSDGQALKWIRDNYQWNTVELPSFAIRYPENGHGLMLSLLWQALKFKPGKQRASLMAYHEKEAFDAVLSDNRYACFLPGVRSIFITHQTHPILPFIPHKVSGWLHQQQLKGFREIWIVDNKHERKAGKLSEAFKSSRFVQRYIGFLSRFKDESQHAKDIDLLFVLSGPKGSKTALFKEIETYILSNPNKNIVVVGDDQGALSHTHAQSFSTLGKLALKELLSKAKHIVSRSGYSSIMDYGVFSARKIWIPSPGQTEQEYLGKLQSERGDICLKQGELERLNRLIEAEPK
jgi:UDP:flavonoid glycosyltransferase YjiC (YdhE family)